MALLFSYGSLQQAEVQQAIFARRLEGQPDELLRFEPARVSVADPHLVATTGKTHHANVRFNGNPASRVAGMVFEISDAELANVDRYEAAFRYARVTAPLLSGRQAWVYLHAVASPSEGDETSA